MYCYVNKKSHKFQRMLKYTNRIACYSVLFLNFFKYFSNELSQKAQKGNMQLRMCVICYLVLQQRACCFACETQQNNLNIFLPAADKEHLPELAKKKICNGQKRSEFLDEKWCAFQMIFEKISDKIFYSDKYLVNV